MKKHTAFLNSLHACSEATAFADQHRSLKAAWEACPRPDWMLWLLSHVNHRDDKAYRLFACWCVRNTPLPGGRKVWDLLTDDRSKNAVVVAERFANGEATEQELDAAWDAARAAARDASRAAAWDAARDAAWDAARDAARAAARAAARDAARAAARDAARAAAWDAASGAAWDAARDAQSNRLREVFPWSAMAKAIKAHEATR